MRYRYIHNNSGGIPCHRDGDPTRQEKPNVTQSAEDRPIGGLGILLIRELMDSINYERTNGQNVLALVKSLNR